MYETDTETIKKLFYQQVAEMTRRTNAFRSNSFDYQFSDQWIPGVMLRVKQGHCAEY